MRVILDIDDVLADTFGALEAHFGKAADASIEDLDVMFPGVDLSPALESIEFHLEIPLVEGAVAGVSRIVDAGHNAMYLSSRPHSMQEATDAWLRRWLFPDLQLRCIGRKSKQAVLRTDPYDLLIDDQLRYLTIARERGSRAIAMANPWNSSWSGESAESWAQIAEVL